MAERYVAFISYRHTPSDTKIAREVQRAIETYRLPKGISAHPEADGDKATADGIPGSHGTDERKGTSRALGKCFRDEDELAASHSLPQRIEEALERSEKLIVICSPEAVESDWVNREIAEFIRLHGPENVIPVLASGSSEDSIPDILRTKHTAEIDGKWVERTDSPLAADLRKGANGAEMLRIIASVAGVDYDDLRQRQKRRRNGRIAIWIAVSVVLAVLIAWLMVVAVTPSDEQSMSESRELAGRSAEQLA